MKIIYSFILSTYSMKRIIFYSCILLNLFIACENHITISEVFDEVSKIERFEIREYSQNRYGFPEYFGNGIVCAHPNSSCKGEVIDLLNRLPKEWMACEIKDGERQFDRFYITPDYSNNDLLFVHVGHRTGNTILILFSNIDKTKVMYYLSKLKLRIDNIDNS